MNKPNKQNKDLKALEASVKKNGDINRADLYGKSKKPSIVLARKAMWTILFDKCGWTMVEIARVFDRSHTSISRGINSFKADKKVCSSFTRLLSVK